MKTKDELERAVNEMRTHYKDKMGSQIVGFGRLGQRKTPTLELRNSESKIDHQVQLVGEFVPCGFISGISLYVSLF